MTSPYKSSDKIAISPYCVSQDWVFHNTWALVMTYYLSRSDMEPHVKSGLGWKTSPTGSCFLALVLLGALFGEVVESLVGSRLGEMSLWTWRASVCVPGPKPCGQSACHFCHVSHSPKAAVPSCSWWIVPGNCNPKYILLPYVACYRCLSMATEKHTETKGVHCSSWLKTSVSSF